MFVRVLVIFREFQFFIVEICRIRSKNFVVTTTDPKGLWSEMHIIEGADGIDPSLFFDEDGKVYYTGTTRFEDEQGTRQGIWCSEININKMEMVPG